MKEHGSDKGDDWHNYTITYSQLLEQYRETAAKVLEVGIGTNNTKFQSAMKPEYTPGGSLRGWRDWFTVAEVYGADIDRDILFEEERIKTFELDQTNELDVLDMWDQFDEDVVFDVIIDDGLHTLEAATTLFAHSVHMLADDGLYIIEDIQGHSEQAYRSEFAWYAEETGLQFEYLTLPHATNKTDNNILVLWYGDSEKASQAMESIKLAS
jgi:hypothetical protein